MMGSGVRISLAAPVALRLSGVSPGLQLFPTPFTTGRRGGRPESVCPASIGAVGRTPKGSWSASTRYDILDLVNYQDCSYLATRSNPGKPGVGEGWQMIAAKEPKGDLGSRGPRGARGDRGAAGTPVTIVGWSLDIENYRARPAMNNGEVGAILDLRPLFERFHDETQRA
jgi:hypothetical protein